LLKRKRKNEILTEKACAITEIGEPSTGAKFTITIPKLNKHGKENYQIVP
jgi:hypothetical protein